LEGCKGSFGNVTLIERVRELVAGCLLFRAYIPILISYYSHQKSSTHLIPFALINQIQQCLALDQSIEVLL